VIRGRWTRFTFIRVLHELIIIFSGMANKVVIAFLSFDTILLRYNKLLFFTNGNLKMDKVKILENIKIRKILFSILYFFFKWLDTINAVYRIQIHPTHNKGW